MISFSECLSTSGMAQPATSQWHLPKIYVKVLKQLLNRLRYVRLNRHQVSIHWWRLIVIECGRRYWC